MKMIQKGFMIPLGKHWNPYASFYLKMYNVSVSSASLLGMTIGKF